MQIFIYCKVTLHVSSVTAPINICILLHLAGFFMNIVYYIFKKYVHQTFNDKSPLLLATSLCLSLVWLLRTISGERPTVVNQHGSGPLSLISFLHCCNFLMKTFTMLITNHAAVVGEEIEVGMKHVYLLRTSCNQVCDTMTTCPQSSPCS